MTKRILLAGAAGFLGSHLADRLLDDGHDVTGIDNLVTGRRLNLAHLDGHPRFRLIEADVSAPLQLGTRPGLSTPQGLSAPVDWVLNFGGSLPACQQQ